MTGDDDKGHESRNGYRNERRRRIIPRRRSGGYEKRGGRVGRGVSPVEGGQVTAVSWGRKLSA